MGLSFGSFLSGVQNNLTNQVTTAAGNTANQLNGKGFLGQALGAGIASALAPSSPSIATVAPPSTSPSQGGGKMLAALQGLGKPAVSPTILYGVGAVVVLLLATVAWKAFKR